MQTTTVDSPRGVLQAKPRPYLSVVIPVFNEEASLPALFTRMYAALDGLRLPYECLFVDDGSDASSLNTGMTTLRYGRGFA